MKYRHFSKSSFNVHFFHLKIRYLIRMENRHFVINVLLNMKRATIPFCVLTTNQQSELFIMLVINYNVGDNDLTKTWTTWKIKWIEKSVKWMYKEFYKVTRYLFFINYQVLLWQRSNRNKRRFYPRLHVSLTFVYVNLTNYKDKSHSLRPSQENKKISGK